MKWLAHYQTKEGFQFSLSFETDWNGGYFVLMEIAKELSTARLIDVEEDLR